MRYRIARLIRAPRLKALTIAIAAAFVIKGSAQSLTFVPPIYNVPLSSNTLLATPAGMAVDAHGALYIVDTGHSQVWKFDAFDETSLVAGTGATGYTGDGGLAADATLNAPTAIAVDIAGNVFIADTGNYAIRRVDAVTGVITTICGGNGHGDSGDNGPATAAELEKPVGLAVDAADEIFIADAEDTQIRKIQTNGVILWYGGEGTPATGNGDGGFATGAKFISPAGLALDAAGNLYIADRGAGNVRKIDTNGKISTVAGTGVQGNSGLGGPATSAKLNSPAAVAIDADGNLFIADNYTGYLTEVDGTGTINLIAGKAVFGGVGDGEPAYVVQLLAPLGVAVDSSGNVFVNSSTNKAAYRVATHPERFPATAVGQTSANQRLILMNEGSSTITVSAVGAAGDFSVAATPSPSNARPCNSTTWNALPGTAGSNWCTIDLQFTPTAPGVRAGSATVTSNDTPSTLAQSLTSVGMSPAVAVSDGAVYTIAGIYPDILTNHNDDVLATSANLGVLGGFAYDSAGNLFIVESGFCDVRRVDAKTGIISTVVGDGSGNCGYGGDGGSATAAQLSGPNAVAFGPDGTMYISDAFNSVIRSVDAAGKIHTYGGQFVIPHQCSTSGDGSQVGSVDLCGATSLRFDSAGNLYFPEGQTNTIRKVTPAGVLSTAAGTYLAADGYAGDGGPATSAQLAQPLDVAFDSHNNMYFTDSHNEIVRRVDATTHTITTVAGTPKVQGYSGDGGLATEATLNRPGGIDVDAAGNIYIADTDNWVIRKVSAASGIITTVAGNFKLGNAYNGEGVPATSAGIDLPEFVRLDSQGDIVFSDNNPLVRKVSPNGLVDFGDQQLAVASASHSLTISNVGNTALKFDSTTPYAIDGDFALATGGTCDFTQPLAPGANCTVNVTFTPPVLYERYGTLNLNDNGVGSPQITELRGNGINPAASAQISVTPLTLTFASQAAGTTSTAQLVTVSNPGSATVHISQISIGGANPGQFTSSTGCGGAALATNQSCTVSVSFAPTSAGSFAETISVVDDATGSPQTVSVTGTGTAAAAGALTITPTTLAFGSQLVGTQSGQQLITLKNTGTAPVNISSIASTGDYGQFSIGQTCVGTPLAVGSSCTLNGVFTPSQVGSFTVSTTVASDTSTSPQTVTLTGTGVAGAPQATLSPTAISFNSQSPGVRAASSTTLSNIGNATLHISSIGISGPGALGYAVGTGTNACGTTVAAGASCIIYIQFDPPQYGPYTATLSVADDAAGSPQTASISGSSLVPPADFAVSATPAVASVAAAGSTQIAVALSSPIAGDPFTNPITLSATGAPAGWTVSLNPATVTPNPLGPARL